MQAPWHPGTLLELSGSYWKTCVLHTAVKLDIFTAIGDDSLTSSQLSKKIDASTEGIDRLLNALAAMELLARVDTLFSNIEPVGDLLRKDSSRYLGHIIQHHHYLMESWSRLDRAVLSGEANRTKSSFSDPLQRESFLMGMFNIAMAVAPKIVPLLDLTGHRRLMDLGGGPGTYAIHFCRSNPHLSATVIDLPTTRPFAEKTISRFDLSDRIHFQDGDYLKGRIDGRFDVAWLSHILHSEGPEDCRNIIGKVVDALEPGGLIAIHEFILDDTRDGPLFPALFSLNMLLGTASGRSYTEHELTAMLTEAGFGQIAKIPVDTPNDSAILTAVLQKEWV